MTQDATTWWILLWVFCLVDLRLWAGLTYDLLDWVRTDRHRPNRLLIIVIAVVGVLGIIVIELTASKRVPTSTTLAGNSLNSTEHPQHRSAATPSSPDFVQMSASRM